MPPTRARRDRASGAPPSGAAVAAFVVRERSRALLRSALPRRQARAIVVRGADEMTRAFRSSLVDIAVVDLGAPPDDALRSAALAREFPTVAFVALTPFHASDARLLARCAELGFADALADVVDDAVLRHTLDAHRFSRRFAHALRMPPSSLGLSTALQLAAWRAIIAHAGRPVRTTALARELGVTREHLSRSFPAAGAPTLKRAIDLVRVLAAAELAKNPGYDLRDVARVLGFASSSHLGRSAQRLVGTRGSSLAALRGVDLIERFVRRGA